MCVKMSQEVEAFVRSVEGHYACIQRAGDLQYTIIPCYTETTGSKLVWFAHRKEITPACIKTEFEMQKWKDALAAQHPDKIWVHNFYGVNWTLSTISLKPKNAQK